MNRGWQVVLAVGLTTILIKGLGPLLLSGRSRRLPVRPALLRIAPAVFGALIVTQAFTTGRAIRLDARAGGLGAAVAVSFAGAPPVAILAAAVAVTAAIRRGIR